MASKIKFTTGNNYSIKTMKQIVEEFGSETSLHGIPRVINAKSVQLKIVWSVVFLCSFGMVVFMLTSLTMQYFSYPVVVKVHTVSIEKH